MDDLVHLLSAYDLVSGYGKLQVLWGASFYVDAGETVVLLGPNGAGKTTLLRVLFGLLPTWDGRLALDGQAITDLRTDHRVRRGMVFMSELSIFSGLTIDENIRIGGQSVDSGTLRSRIKTLYANFPDLASRRRALGGSLSGGQRKMLGLAKALAAGPRLLVMDEPSAGLSPLFVQQVIGVLDGFRARGLSLLIAEQNVAFLALADRVLTLEGGRIAFEGTAAEINANDALRRAYFGLT